MLDKNINVLDKPDGYITFVDLDRREVQVNINRHQGARPQMQMTIFDARSPGVPTEKPKGNIELIQVGEQFSIGRITRIASTIEPIRVGDIVYSPAWSPDEPMRFALIGKIDVNRDGKDDREDLKKMIEDAGGIVDYDLPPPEVGTKETGKLTARISWYVTDDRPPLRDSFQSRSDASVAAQSRFLERSGQVIKEAHLEGIRPMPVGRFWPTWATRWARRSSAGPKPSTPRACGGWSSPSNRPGPRPKPPKPAAEPAEAEAGRARREASGRTGRPSEIRRQQPANEAHGPSESMIPGGLRVPRELTAVDVQHAAVQVGPMYRPRGRISRLWSICSMA